MSILIEGIEMPKERESFTVTIKYNGLVFDTETGMQVAEAQEVPPHGDLVDGTEMREIAISLLDKAVTDQEANAIREMWSHLGQMPVFIPADKEGE